MPLVSKAGRESDLSKVTLSLNLIVSEIWFQPKIWSAILSMIEKNATLTMTELNIMTFSKTTLSIRTLDISIKNTPLSIAKCQNI
jgi:hypothetical protein